jgi:hypothetical protein
MDQGEPETHSFVVKLWCEEPASEAGEALWRGHITHIPNGERRYVQDLKTLSCFIAAYVKDMPWEQNYD